MAETVTAGTVVPHEPGTNKAFPPLNPNDFAPQIIWLALTFAVLYVLLSRLVIPRIAEVIEERKDRIQRDLAAAERLKSETEKALSAYEKALTEARASATGIARETREKLAAEVDKDRNAAEAALTAKLADAEAKIGATKTKALASIKDVASDTAGSIISALTGLSASKDEIDRALADK